jgi:hypothetical protein
LGSATGRATSKGVRPSDALILIGYTLGSAIGIVLLETYIKFMSRLTRAGPKFPLTRDDADWWIEWVVAATVALMVFITTNALEHKPVSIWQVTTAIVAVLLGYGALPTIASVFCLDDNGRVASTPALFVLNLVALFMLMATVSVGVKIYAS